MCWKSYLSIFSFFLFDKNIILQFKYWDDVDLNGLNWTLLWYFWEITPLYLANLGYVRKKSSRMTNPLKTSMQLAIFACQLACHLVSLTKSFLSDLPKGVGAFWQIWISADMGSWWKTIYWVYIFFSIYHQSNAP